MDTMTKEDILHVLNSHLKDGKYLLAVLKKQSSPIYKQKLAELTNQFYSENVEEKPLLTNRHMIDIYFARLEGAGLIEPEQMGPAVFYKLTPLAEELIRFNQQKK